MTAGSVAMAVGSALLAGCGGSSTASGPGGGATTPTAVAVVALPADQAQKRACGLVTQAEVEAALGARVTPGKEETQPARSLCGFEVVAGPDQRVLIVSTSSSGVPAAYADSRAKATSPQPVSAGDEAFVAGAQAVVRKGDTMVALLVAVRQQPAQLAAAAAKLAQAVGSRL